MVRKWIFFLFFVFSFLGKELFPATWNLDNDGNWNVDGNWITPAIFPNAIDAEAIFSTVITADRVITLGESITVGTVTFDDNNNYTITDAVNTLIFDSAGTPSLTISNTNGNGAHTIASSVMLNQLLSITQDSTSPFTFSGTISGNGGVSKLGSETVVFSGTSNNTYVGNFILNSGTVILNKTGANAIPGTTMLIQSGVLQLAGTNQISDAALMFLNGGTFDMGGFPEAIGILNFMSGNIVSGNTLTLRDVVGSSSLTMANVTISNDITVASLPTGGIFFNNVANGTAVISGNLNLGNATRNFSIANGTAAIDMLISGVISNGGVNKVDTGTLAFTGVNTYGLGTTVTAGTLQVNSLSLPGNVTDNATLVFDQNFSGTYAGAITGTGDIIKQGSGNLILTGISNVAGSVSVAAGKLTVNGSLTASTEVNVLSGAVVGGTGTIDSAVTVNGTLAPGDNGIGTITLTSTILANGSLLENEISPTSTDLVLSGTVEIQPGATLLVVPQIGTYSRPSTYVIIQAGMGNVSGTFSTVTSIYPAFQPTVIYLLDQVLLQILANPFQNIVSKGNAGAVAKCLDQLQPCQGSDLETVIQILLFSSSLKELTQNLNQLQPSQYTELILSQETITKDIADILFNRLQRIYEVCIEPCTSFWVSPLSDFSSQNNKNSQPGYTNQSYGILLGIDHNWTGNFYAGLGFGYINTSLDWKQSRGDASINNYYLDLYATWLCNWFYIKGALLGGYNQYDITRKIKVGSFQTFTSKAKSNHNGLQGSAHLELGLLFEWCSFLFSPFGEVDYLYFHEDHFKEHNAQNLNLTIASRNSNVLISELGLYISNCFFPICRKLAPFLQFSVLRESRFKGKGISATFKTSSCCADCASKCSFDVRGYYPSRTLYSGEAGLTFFLPCEDTSLSLGYKGKFGKHFRDNLAYVQFVLNF